jgi:L-alanine-DL-glutamate epimerase and related enzymes of enolase superfamily
MRDNGPMHLSVRPLPLTKRHALTISRGTSAGSDNLLVSVTQDGITGIGEFSAVSQCDPPETAATATAQLTLLAEALQGLSPWEAQRVESLAAESGVGRAAYCALDMALYDWLGKRLGAPVYRLLGGDTARIVPTSVTVGILPPDEAAERAREWIARTGARSLKIKLGSPAGTDADEAMYAAVREAAPDGVALRVDANGGWRSPEEARRMMRFLAERGAEYVEQPLAKGREAELPAVFEGRPLPIYADESCAVAEDVPGLADRVDGVNLKLMKAGGIRPGMRLIHAARAHGLSVMMGCMSESSLAIAASAAISPYADHLDLDSHLNLAPDPFAGLGWEDGRVLPSEAPGLGVWEG